MKKYCVSLELAKEMEALGFEQESEFYWQIEAKDYSPEEEIIVKKEKLNNIFSSYSAYTVGELGEVLSKYMCYTHFLPDSKRWVCYIIDIPDLDPETEADTEANARAKMLIYLKKEGII